MSAPVDIVRPASALSARSQPGSPSRLYVPVHKRTASGSPPASPPRALPRARRDENTKAPDSPPRASHRRESDRGQQPLEYPQQPAIPVVYPIPALLALAASPLVPHALSPAQSAHIESLHPYMLRKPRPSPSPAVAAAATPSPHPAPAPAASPESLAAPRRRPARGGRRNSTAKKLQAAAVDVDGRRRRRGWGWQEHASAEDSWRHPAAAQAY